MRRKLGRRAFLGGLSVAVGLPFLPSLMHSRKKLLGAIVPAVGPAHAQSASGAPLRLLVYYVPNGVFLGGPAPRRRPESQTQAGAWMPSTQGEDYELSELLAPIEPVRDDVLVITGLTNGVGVPPGFGGAHACGMGSLLTCHQYNMDGNINLTRSVDQLIGDHVGQDTALRTLELGIDDNGGQDGPGILHTNLSWIDEDTPAPPILDPQDAFDRLFGGFDPNATSADAERRRVFRTSVLDAVLTDTEALASQLSTSDKAKLEGYIDAIRDVEMRIQTAPSAGACNVPDGLEMVNGDFPNILSMNHDLIALGFECDATRVVSLMLGHAQGGRSYPWAGVNGDGHAVTHHDDNPNSIAAQKRIDAWRVGQMAALAERFKNITDVDGNSLLHNTLIYYTSEIADGNRHNQENKAILLAGQLGGQIRTGRHIQFPTDANNMFRQCDEVTKEGCDAPQLGNLYVTLLQMFGRDDTSFGQTGTGVYDLS